MRWLIKDNQRVKDFTQNADFNLVSGVLAMSFNIPDTIQYIGI